MKEQIREMCINALKVSHTNIHQAIDAANKGEITESKNKARLAIISITNALISIE